MAQFDTKVQEIKNKVLTEVAKEAWNGTLMQNLLDIPKRIVPGRVPTMRCCVYKERAILAERVKIAMGGDSENPNVVEVIDIACEECPMGGYEVTNSCQGCLAHRCEHACKRGAITFDSKHVAHIDKSKCVECGACAKACQFGAILNFKRPCQASCKVKAISMDENKLVHIDSDKCIGCGQCAHLCPFGAIMAKSYILNAIDVIKNSNGNTAYNTYAIVAPALASQFSCKLGQVVTGIKQLGFGNVLEVALGADLVAMKESDELAERGFLTSSCCPAFVQYVRKFFPELSGLISDCDSPMVELAKYIKSKDNSAKVVFIGPCTAKKLEATRPEVVPFVDVVLTFQELQALFDSKEIEITTLADTPLDNASYFGRIFARSGGLSEAVKQAVAEQKIDFDVKACVCDGIEACRVALIKKNRGILDANFIEGMACTGGCAGGAGNLTQNETNGILVDKYAKTSTKQSITQACDDTTATKAE